MLGALAVPPFVASLRRGPRGMALALSAELVSLVAIAVLTHGPLDPAQGTGTITWVLTGVGVGLIGSFVHSAMPPPVDPLQPYRDAQALIRDLIGISGELTSGLDPVSLGTTIADAVRDELPVTALVVQVPRDDELTPLVVETDSAEADTGVLQDLALATRPDDATLGLGQRLRLPADDRGPPGRGGQRDRLLPARVEGRQPRGPARRGRASGSRPPRCTSRPPCCSPRSATPPPPRSAVDSPGRCTTGSPRTSPRSATWSTGWRPARSSPEQETKLRTLRERITAVVGEVRRSVRTLRTEADGSESLGTAIGGLARHLSESSGIPIQVTVDERTARLRPEVESELLRIAQESMNNAVRHARPSLIEVRCSRRRPRRPRSWSRTTAAGWATGRPDSWGLEIMRERALLIGAELTIEDAEPHGTVVTGRVPAPRVGVHQPSLTTRR